MAHLNVPSAAIFSPSVARQAASAARDWNYVDGWLTSRYRGHPTPSFERNPDTLKALHALASLNEAADEERDAVARAEASVLRESIAAASAAAAKAPILDDLQGAFLDAIDTGLTREGSAALDALAAAALELNVAHPRPQDMGQKLIRLRARSFDLEQMQVRLDALQAHIDDETTRIDQLLMQLEGDDFKSAPDLARQNVNLQRRIRATASKLSDTSDRDRDRDRDRDPRGGSGGPTIEDIVAQERAYLLLSARRRELDHQLSPFHGLPTEPDAARAELERIRRELRTLSERRDAIFEGLVERESPVKRRV